jgi:hypothetical protein
MRVSDENLHGRTVIAADGQAVGEIAPLLQSLNIRLRKEVAASLEPLGACSMLPLSFAGRNGSIGRECGHFICSNQ